MDPRKNFSCKLVLKMPGFMPVSVPKKGAFKTA